MPLKDPQKRKEYMAKYWARYYAEHRGHVLEMKAMRAKPRTKACPRCGKMFSYFPGHATACCSEYCEGVVAKRRHEEWEREERSKNMFAEHWRREQRRFEKWLAKTGHIPALEFVYYLPANGWVNSSYTQPANTGRPIWEWPPVEIEEVNYGRYNIFRRAVARPGMDTWARRYGYIQQFDGPGCLAAEFSRECNKKRNAALAQKEARRVAAEQAQKACSVRDARRAAVQSAIADLENRERSKAARRSAAAERKRAWNREHMRRRSTTARLIRLAAATDAIMSAGA